MVVPERRAEQSRAEQSNGMDTWIKHSNAVLAAMDNGGYKNSPATRACGYVCCIVCCSPCTVWSSVWRIVACLFRGPGYMCDGNECTKYTDKCICFCIEAVEERDHRKFYPAPTTELVTAEQKAAALEIIKRVEDLCENAMASKKIKDAYKMCDFIGSLVGKDVLVTNCKAALLSLREQVARCKEA